MNVLLFGGTGMVGDGVCTAVAANGYPKRALETPDINALGSA